MSCLWLPTGMAQAPKIWLHSDLTETAVEAGTTYISSWRDAAGSASVPVSSYNNRPIRVSGLSRQVARFDGLDDSLTLAGSFLSLTSAVNCAWAFAVYRKRTLDATNGDRPIIWIARGTSGAARFSLAHGSGSTKNNPMVGGRRLDGDAYAAAIAPEIGHTDWLMSYGVLDYVGNSASIWVNGALAKHEVSRWSTGGATSATAATHPAAIGNSTNLNTSSDIDLAGLLFGAGSTPPSEADIAKIFGWAAHEYGLTSLLPTDHLYKTTPPLAGPAVELSRVRALDEVHGTDTLRINVKRYVNESTIMPQHAKVTLMRARDKRPFRRVWSDETGEAVFSSVRTDQRYIALAEYPSNPDDPGAENYLRPVAGVSRLKGESS